MEKVSEKWGLFFCKLLKVLDQIALWFIGFAIGIVFLIAVAFPCVASQISVGNGKAEAFGYKVKYATNDKKELVVTYDKKTYTIDSLNKIDKDFDAKVIVDFIDDFPYAKIVICMEIGLVTALYVLIMTFIITKKTVKAFKTTIKNKSPFDESVAVRLRQISKLYLWIFLGTLMADIAMEIVVCKYDWIHFQVPGIGISAAIVFYILAWAVKVGIQEREAAKAVAAPAETKEAPKKKRTTKKKEA